jgi:hypothetical protein
MPPTSKPLRARRAVGRGRAEVWPDARAWHCWPGWRRRCHGPAISCSFKSLASQVLRSTPTIRAGSRRWDFLRRRPARGPRRGGVRTGAVQRPCDRQAHRSRVTAAATRGGGRPLDSAGPPGLRQRLWRLDLRDRAGGRRAHAGQHGLRARGSVRTARVGRVQFLENQVDGDRPDGQPSSGGLGPIHRAQLLRRLSPTGLTRSDAARQPQRKGSVGERCVYLILEQDTAIDLALRLTGAVMHQRPAATA